MTPIVGLEAFWMMSMRTSEYLTPAEFDAQRPQEYTLNQYS